MLVRSVAWLVLIGLVWFGRAASADRVRCLSLACIAGFALAASSAFAGHASIRDPAWLLIPSDIIHVVAMAVWTGGLAAMLPLLPVATRQLPEPADRTVLLTRATLGFSALAFAGICPDRGFGFRTGDRGNRFVARPD